ncbi:MAG: hypothetical protein ACOZCO_15695 [Bacteroidota bacterium]
MKNYFLISIVLLFFSCSSSEEKKKNNLPDLSTDEAVVKEVNKGRENTIEKEDICIERPEAFKDLILVGFFADDRGCMFETAFYKNEKIDVEKASSQILIDNGWEKRENKADLALEWVTNVSALWETVVSERPEYFDTTGEHVFSAPEIQLQENGGVIIKTWIKEPAGMAPEDEYYLLRIDFSDKGKIMNSEVVDRYTEIYLNHAGE